MVDTFESIEASPDGYMVLAKHAHFDMFFKIPLEEAYEQHLDKLKVVTTFVNFPIQTNSNDNDCFQSYSTRALNDHLICFILKLGPEPNTVPSVLLRNESVQWRLITLAYKRVIVEHLVPKWGQFVGCWISYFKIYESYYGRGSATNNRMQWLHNNAIDWQKHFIARAETFEDQLLFLAISYETYNQKEMNFIIE